MTTKGAFGDDTIVGTSGDDIFNLGRGGNDTVSGGAGDDTFWFAGTFTAADKVDGGADNDKINLNGDYAGAHAVVFAADTMVNVEHMFLGSGHSYELTLNDANVAAGKLFTVDARSLTSSDHLTFDGSAELNGRFNIYAGAGNDVLSGGAKNDTFHLDKGGNDTVHGGAGADLIDMGGSFNASDTIDGGTGNDGVFIDGMSGDDNIAFTATTMTNIEYLGLGAGHFYTLSTVDATVASGQQMIIDGSLLGAGDVLTFNGAAETNGHFYIAGGAGNDVLTGGQAGDIFDLSFGGNDTATAGNGLNTFYMGAALTAADHIAGGTGSFDSVFLAGDYTGARAVVFDAATMTGIEALEFERGHSYDIAGNDATVGSGQTLTVDGSFLGFSDTLKFDGSAETNGSFDFLDGNGNDTFIGGAGGDNFSFELGGHDIGQGNDGDDFFDACGTFTAADQFDGGGDYDIMELSAGETPSGSYTGAKALHLDASNFANFEELDLDGGGNYAISTTDGVVASGLQFLVDASTLNAGDVLTFDGSAESDGTFAFSLYAGIYRLTGGAGNDVFLVHDGFTALDHIDGGGNSGGAGNEIDFDGDYTGANALVLSASNIKNVQNLFFAGDHSYDITTNDNNFAAGDSVVVDGTAVQFGNSLIFDASAETDAQLTIYDGAGDDVLTGGTGQITNFTMLGAGDDTVHTNFSFTGQNFIAMGSFLTAADTIDGNVGFDQVELAGDYTGANAVVFGAATMTGVDTLLLDGGYSYDLTTNDATVDSALNPSLTVDSTNLLATDTLHFDGSAESDSNFLFDVGAETDTLIGGAFGDTFNMGANFTAADSIDGGGGFDTVFLVGDYSAELDISSAMLVHVEDLVVSGSHAYNIKIVDDAVAGTGMVVDAGTATGPLTFDGAAETSSAFTVYDGIGNDAITTGGGGDQINLIHGGTDTVHAGGGDDAILAAGTLTAADFIDGGTGSDTIVLDGDYSGGPTLIDNLASIEFIDLDSGHSYNLKIDDSGLLTSTTVDAGSLGAGDSLTFLDSGGAPHVFTFIGGAGDDVLSGFGGADTYNLNNGGNDTATGGGYNDFFVMEGALTTADRIDGGAGFNQMTLNGDYSAGLVLSATTLLNIQSIGLGAGHSYNITTDDATVASAATLNVNGSALLAGDTLTFDGSAETNGSFTLTGGAGDDVLTGGALSDGFNLTAGGNDTAHGGAGNDTFSFGAAFTAADTVDGGANNDTISLSGDYSAGITLGATTITSIENIVTNVGHDYKLTMNNGNVASGGTLTIIATALGSGNTLTFDGSAETDGHFTIQGGAGADTITSGSLADTITGGAGADHFVYASGATSSSTWHDTITDFAAGADKFDLGGGVSGIYAISGHIDAASLDSQLAGLDAMHIGGATVVTVTSGDLSGHTFLMVDGDGNAFYNAGSDYLFDITNYTGTITTGDFI